MVAKSQTTREVHLGGTSCTGATTWNLSGFSTLLVPVFIKTFINSICKILIKLLDLQIPSRPVVEKVSSHQQKHHARHHQPPDQNPSINLTPKRRTRLSSRSRRSRSRNPTTTTTRRGRPRSSTSRRSRIALACEGSAEEDDSFRSSRSSRRSCRSNKSIIPPHPYSCSSSSRHHNHLRSNFYRHRPRRRPYLPDYTRRSRSCGGGCVGCRRRRKRRWLVACRIPSQSRRLSLSLMVVVVV